MGLEWRCNCGIEHSYRLGQEEHKLTPVQSMLLLGGEKQLENAY